MANIEKLFLRYLKLSAKLRPEYPGSLGTVQNPQHARATLASLLPTVPELHSCIYGQVAGTPSGIEDSSLLDFVPGFRLLHLDELGEAYRTCKKLHSSNMVPLLANDSSDFIAVDVSTPKQAVWSLDHVEGTDLLHAGAASFLETLCAFYEKKVYFIEDGRLENELDDEAEVGARLNPGIEYWSDE